MLQASAVQFALAPSPDAESDNRTHVRVVEVVEPLKTTLVMLSEGPTRICLITTHFGWTTPVNVSDAFRQTVADDLGMPISHVLLFSSHNHCCVAFADNAVQQYASYLQDVPQARLTPIGEGFLSALRKHAGQLTQCLQPVTVWWAEGFEDRITYNRKGRRQDGTTYFMREEDRILVSKDFRGDIETRAPVVVLKDLAGKAVAALAQFTGHPVTAYHPEKPIVFGEWPQLACDLLEERVAGGSFAPVAFLQGCAGDVSSKEMFSGGVARSRQFGRMLGQSFIDALRDLQPSARDGLDFATEAVRVPLAPLPSREVLSAELREMDDFIASATAGAPDTLSCVGQNFPQALSSQFRARLVATIRDWNVWALQQHDAGRVDWAPKYIELVMAVIRIGDVGIVGMPCEPFQGIGRQIYRGSPLPIVMPCGYLNISHGYITDSANTGDQEYMSAHHRYTRFRPAFAEPAGDVLAQAASQILGRFAQTNESMNREAPHQKFRPT